MSETFKVGMAEAMVAVPPDKLACFGIGSCVCVALYDPSARLAGLAHSMLPEPPGLPGEETAKYVGSAVPELVLALENRGASRKRLYARLIGGATMFSFSAKPAAEGAELSLGERNLKAARECLRRLSISITAEEAGGNVGRSLEFDPMDGSLLVRTAWAELRWL